jgi:hypothetical protein
MNRLLQIGFVPVGDWQLNENRVIPILNQLGESENVIYCFIIELLITQYDLPIGKTSSIGLKLL